jgi:hypothetical protein
MQTNKKAVSYHSTTLSILPLSIATALEGLSEFRGEDNISVPRRGPEGAPSEGKAILPQAELCGNRKTSQAWTGTTDENQDEPQTLS